jgi:hypothetical protein
MICLSYTILVYEIVPVERRVAMVTEDLIVGVIEVGDAEYELLIVEVDEGKVPHDDPFVRVKVFSPRVPDAKWFRFRKDQTVGSAAEHSVLDRASTLEAAGVRNRETLELVDAGTGV